jgi:hypothetical protein
MKTSIFSKPQNMESVMVQVKKLMNEEHYTYEVAVNILWTRIENRIKTLELLMQININ